MAKPLGLVLRNGWYSFRTRLPQDLVGKVKGRHRGWGSKEIIFALGTSDRKKAIRAAKDAASDVEALFDYERERLGQEGGQEVEIRKVSALSQNQVKRLVTRWFVEVEEKAENWFEEKGANLSKEDKMEALKNTELDLDYYTGYDLQGYPEVNLNKKLKEFLKKESLEVEEGSEVYEVLHKLFRMGMVENLRRQVARLNGNRVAKFDERFWENVQPQLNHEEIYTLEQLVERFLQAQKDVERSNATLKSYKAPIKLLYDALGKDTLLSEITQERVSQVLNLIPFVPVNARQRYGKQSLAKLVEQTKDNLNIRKIAKRTQGDYFSSMNVIFNYAIESKMMQDNPLNNRRYKQRFDIKKEKRRRKKKPFTDEELSRIFQAPIYTGCQNDGHHYAKAGDNRPKRGRFWVPLIGLFHGMRLNETIQLYTEDIIEEGGRLCFYIREEIGENTSCDKTLKTDSSRRKVPVHPELRKIGFWEFVEERQADKKAPRLFPELPIGQTGYYSDPFQKWFGRFLTHALGYKPKATFHSFRHMWTDQMRRAGVPEDMRQALGGWSNGESLEAHYGEGYPIEMKYEVLSKVEYPKLDLSHLHVSD